MFHVDSVQHHVSPASYLRITVKPNQLLLSPQQSELFQIINFVFLCTFVCFFGITANTLNIIVFFKQGFSYSVNISLCGLAFSDLFCLIMELWFNISMNPLLRKADIPFVSEEVQYLTGSVPSVCFGRITGWITVFITAERCLSIAMPLKVKQIITMKKTTVIICAIYVANILAILPEYRNFYMEWKFFPNKNITLYGLSVGNPTDGVDTVGYVLTAFIGYASFVCLIVFTFILVIKLNEKSAWRKKATRANERSESLASRDKKTVKMIVLIAIIMIICFTPGTILAIYMVFEPEFSIMGLYQSTFFSLWSLAFVFQNINSSVNIVLYYRMSTKYRQTFNELFARCHS